LPVNILNIVGDGCAMDGETGDGIVKKRSALLDGAANVIINGTCDESKFSYLHVDLLDLKKYPEVYTSIVNYLKA